MASPYSTRFLVAKGATSDLSYVVPAGFVAVVRDLDSYSNVTGAADIFLENAAGGAIWWFHWGPTDEKPAQWQGRQVFEAGETIRVHISVGSLDAIDVAVSGYLLTA